MRKNIIQGVLGGLLVIVLAVAAVSVAFAAQPLKGEKGLKGQAGESNTAFIELWQKDSIWNIVADGAWGKMKYNLVGSTFDYLFNGHRLVPDTSYTLIYYPGPWPGSGLICLGSGIADIESNLNLEASVNTGDLPAPYDEYYPVGAKIWLVLSSDVDCTNRMMVGWNSTSYLFEYDKIIFVDTDSPYLYTHSLNLWQKDGAWNIVDDGANGTLDFYGSAPAFYYNFTAGGLSPGTGYSLIYYADPWPGNNPGALIASGTTDGSGNLTISDSIDLGLDLPTLGDANYPTGAKIQLVLSADYNPASKSLTGWHPLSYLFEENLVTYDDTDVP